MVPGICFVLESFRRHMDSGRWLFQLGMEAEGWVSAGGELPPPGVDSTDVAAVVESFRPQVAILWPRYEWDPAQWKGPQVTPAHCFRNIEPLVARSDVLRVAVFHDAGSERRRQREWHEEFKPHVWLTWYHPKSVCELAPHVPAERIVRTWHVIDADRLLPFEGRMGMGVVSGAFTDDVYPFRSRVIKAARNGQLQGVAYHPHPGYSQAGAKSADYIRLLSGYRVAICSCSAYKFALKKHIEATAAGCVVVTNLPDYDRLPWIDGNLIRVRDDIPLPELEAIVHDAAARWDFDRQKFFAAKAAERFDYRRECGLLAARLGMEADDLAAGNCPWARGG